MPDFFKEIRKIKYFLDINLFINMIDKGERNLGKKRGGKVEKNLYKSKGIYTN